MHYHLKSPAFAFLLNRLFRVPSVSVFCILKLLSISWRHVSCSPQVIPKLGRTNLSLETQTTWWVQTVCLCSLTTSEEGNSWPVTECDKAGDPSLPCRARSAVHNAWWSMNSNSRCLLCPKLKKLKKHKHTQGESESSIPKAVLVLSFLFFFFLVWCLQGLQKIKMKTLFKQKELELECMTSATDWIITFWHF